MPAGSSWFLDDDFFVVGDLGSVVVAVESIETSALAAAEVEVTGGEGAADAGPAFAAPETEALDLRGGMMVAEDLSGCARSPCGDTFQ